MVELSVIQLTSCISLTPLLNLLTHLSTPVTSTTQRPPVHSPNTYHPYSRITVHPSKPYHIINTGPVIIPARTNTIMTIPCALPHSRNYLFDPRKQSFVDQPVQHTPVIFNAENDSLPVHFINHGDHEVVIPKHSYVVTMVKVQKSNKDILPTNISPEPVIQHTLYQHTGNVKSIKQEHTAPASTIVIRLKNRWRRCYKTALSNLLLVPGPALLCWLKKQIKYNDSVYTAGALIKPLSKTVTLYPISRIH